MKRFFQTSKHIPPFTELDLNTKGETTMLKRSIPRTFANLLRRSGQSAATSLVLKRVKPLCAIMLCSVMMLGVALSAPGMGTVRSASGAEPQVTLLTRVLDDFTTGLFEAPQTL